MLDNAIRNRLITAAQDGCIETLKRILGALSLDEPEDGLNYIFFEALVRSHFEASDYLLDKYGSHIRREDGLINFIIRETEWFYQNPSKHDLSNGPSAGGTAYLLQRGFPVNSLVAFAKDSFRTPLDTAIEYYHKGAILSLKEHGAKTAKEILGPKFIKDNDDTAYMPDGLIYAIRTGSIEAVIEFLDFCPDFDWPNSEIKPICLSIVNYQFDMARFLTEYVVDISTEEFLLWEIFSAEWDDWIFYTENPANPQLKEPDTTRSEFVLSLGFPINLLVKTWSGQLQTALDKAISLPHTSAITLLRAHGAKTAAELEQGL